MIENVATAKNKFNIGNIRVISQVEDEGQMTYLSNGFLLRSSRGLHHKLKLEKLPRKTTDTPLCLSLVS